MLLTFVNKSKNFVYEILFKIDKEVAITKISPDAKSNKLYVSDSVIDFNLSDFIFIETEKTCLCNCDFILQGVKLDVIVVINKIQYKIFIDFSLCNICKSLSCLNFIKKVFDAVNNCNLKGDCHA